MSFPQSSGMTRKAAERQRVGGAEFLENPRARWCKPVHDFPLPDFLPKVASRDMAALCNAGRLVPLYPACDVFALFRLPIASHLRYLSVTSEAS